MPRVRTSKSGGEPRVTNINLGFGIAVLETLVFGTHLVLYGDVLKQFIKGIRTGIPTWVFGPHR